VARSKGCAGILGVENGLSIPKRAKIHSEDIAMPLADTAG